MPRTANQDSLEALVRRRRFDQPIYVTRPTLPPLDAFRRRLEAAWEDAGRTGSNIRFSPLEGTLEAASVENVCDVMAGIPSAS